jgi:DNA polymerase-3 subunit chi
VTQLAFHFGAPDKLAYAARLLRKAVGSGAQVVVVAASDAVVQLDVDLWAGSPTDFLPHCVASASASVQRHSPLILVSDAAQAPDQHGVLVNLADTVPQGFERFDRLIEVVSTDAGDRDLARKRWRYYTEQGYQITRHDLNLKRAP